MQTNAQQLSTSVTQSYAFRLRPNQDLKKELFKERTSKIH